MQSSNKRIARNTLMLYIRTFVMMPVSLYTSRIILEVLGENDFGVYNVVGGFIALLSLVIIYQFTPPYKKIDKSHFY